MPDINDLISQVKSSGLSKKEKDYLIKCIVRGGPEFDLLAAVNEIKTGKTSPQSFEEKAKAISLLVFIAGVFILFSGVFKPPEPTPPSPIVWAPKDIGEAGKSITTHETQKETANREDTRGGAHVWTKDFVLQRLRSPGTAKFASLWDVNFTDMGNRTWKVDSYVDAQNASGAMVRTYFSSIVRYTGSDRWELISLEMR